MNSKSSAKRLALRIMSAPRPGGNGQTGSSTTERRHVKIAKLDPRTCHRHWDGRLRVDGRTVQAARKGDRAALATLLRELQDPWYRFSLSLLGDADRAREAAQETGLRFLKTIAAFRGDSQLQTWTLGIALNVVREMRRKG